MSAASKVLNLIQDEEIEFVDLRFADMLGKHHHVTFPAHAIDEGTFEDGKMFDGSSIAGWKGINESDMVLMPDPETAHLDPFSAHKQLILHCDVLEPSTMQAYGRDPRSIAKRGEAFLKSTGIADTAFFGPEPEFFIFDSVRWQNDMGRVFYEIGSEEAAWSSRYKYDGTNSGHRPAVKGGYFPVSPVDTLGDLRADMCKVLESLGQVVEVHHHEVANAGQCEIGVKFNTLVKKADELITLKYVIKNVAHQNGKTVTFMPKPLFGDNGSGMHVHSSLWKGNTNVFFEEGGYAGLSQAAKYYIGGILKHAPALLALTSPTTNSYRRLVPGYEAPVNIAYSQRNRSAICRIPATMNPKAKRVEFRAPDPTCNPYLAFSAILMAGLDGVCNEIDPGEAQDRDLYELPAEEKKKIKQVPSSLTEVLDALEADHQFLLEGGVFTPDLLEEYIKYKRVYEVDAIRLRPTPHEYVLYFDC